MTAFIDLIQDYVTLHKSGKHMVGPCPKCGGDPDSTRFVVHLVKDYGHCYSCGFNADSVNLLREMEGLSCPEAHGRLDKRCDRPECPAWSKCSKGEGERPRRDDRATPSGPRQAKAGFTPSLAESPADIWQRKAQEFVACCHGRLLQCPEQLEYLAGRGLPVEAVQRYKLGWIPELEFKDRKSWGLEDKWNEKEQRWTKAMAFQQSILIPWFIDSKVHRLRFRKTQVTGPKDPRYMWVDGSGNDILCLNPHAKAHCVVESDLDGLLVDWTAGSLVGAVPLGSCSTHPKATVHELLRSSLRILVAMDFDGEMRGDKVHAPGAKASWWWQEIFPDTARRWPVPRGKDPGEAYGKGVDIRAWIMAGLPPAMTVKPRQAGKKGIKIVDHFDTDRMQQLISDTFSRVMSACPHGAMEWLDENRSDVVGHLKRAGKAVDRAFEDRTEVDLKKVLAAWEKWHIEAWKRFEERPKVIER